MVLEATMLCIDNSDWMRNEDYAPSRFKAQAQAVYLICGAKTMSNRKNTVGVLTMAGKGVRVMVPPTSDLGKILAGMHDLEIGGEINLAAGIEVAQLALKSRQNRSPIKHENRVDGDDWKLEKNNVELDIVNFGEHTMMGRLRSWKHDFLLMRTIMILATFSIFQLALVLFLMYFL